MDLNKHLEFFNPLEFTSSIHIIGCGAIGSTLAELLTRMGFINLNLYDLDIVEAHNITNQFFFNHQIGKEKTIATANNILSINPEAAPIIHQRYIAQPLIDYVFLCVDNIDTRREIVQTHRFNLLIKAWFDFRIRLTDAQHYAYLQKDVDNFLNTMNFTHEEASQATPTAACGTTLSVPYTVRSIIAVGVANFINIIQNQPYKKLIITDLRALETI